MMNGSVVVSRYKAGSNESFPPLWTRNCLQFPFCVNISPSSCSWCTILVYFSLFAPWRPYFCLPGRGSVLFSICTIPYFFAYFPSVRCSLSFCHSVSFSVFPFQKFCLPFCLFPLCSIFSKASIPPTTVSMKPSHKLAHVYITPYIMNAYCLRVVSLCVTFASENESLLSLTSVVLCQAYSHCLVSVVRYCSRLKNCKLKNSSTLFLFARLRVSRHVIDARSEAMFKIVSCSSKDHNECEFFVQSNSTHFYKFDSLTWLSIVNDRGWIVAQSIW